MRATIGPLRNSLDLAKQLPVRVGEILRQPLDDMWVNTNGESLYRYLKKLREENNLNFAYLKANLTKQAGFTNITDDEINAVLKATTLNETKTLVKRFLTKIMPNVNAEEFLSTCLPWYKAVFVSTAQLGDNLVLDYSYNPLSLKLINESNGQTLFEFNYATFSRKYFNLYDLDPLFTDKNYLQNAEENDDDDWPKWMLELPDENEPETYNYENVLTPQDLLDDAKNTPVQKFTAFADHIKGESYNYAADKGYTYNLRTFKSDYADLKEKVTNKKTTATPVAFTNFNLVIKNPLLFQSEKNNSTLKAIINEIYKTKAWTQYTAKEMSDDAVDAPVNHYYYENTDYNIYLLRKDYIYNDFTNQRKVLRIYRFMAGDQVAYELSDILNLDEKANLKL